MTEVVVLRGTEYERGWGSRPDGYMVFLNQADMVKFLADEQAKKLDYVPDEYTMYDNIGLREVSPRVFQILVDRQGSALYVDKLDELLNFPEGKYRV